MLCQQLQRQDSYWNWQIYSDNKIQKSFQSRLKTHTQSEPMTSLQHLYIPIVDELSFGKPTLISTVFGFKLGYTITFWWTLDQKVILIWDIYITVRINLFSFWRELKHNRIIILQLTLICNIYVIQKLTNSCENISCCKSTTITDLIKSMELDLFCC